ncbi:MAG: hypothetical protein DMF61_23845 [Blastocatellia bacterium AA13]|nr:MAG: hypothetical protein DMF61_23845 [Blastocatellia bacterium AA13]
MSRDKRLYTFLFAPTSTSRMKKLSVPRSFVKAGAIVVLLGLAGAIYGAVRLMNVESINIKYQSAKTENEKLKRDNDVYKNSYAKLKGQISFIEDMSKDLARQANMEQVNETDQKVGSGGPETVTALDKAADSLEQQVRLIGDRLRADHLRLTSIPSGFPVQGYITDGFGMRRNPMGGGSHEFHDGIDLAVDFGTPVGATADGLVVWAAPYSGYGNLVAVFHSNGVTTRYGHLSRITVEPGQRIKRGEQIGYAGSTGRSTGPHVHYEIRLNDQPIDPSKYARQQ